ncbi:hypothetical protein [Longispora fulva]|uniref:Uncharacterized protein n=1 Tax=Longispora fulva TaxID=619741 RepID=A0A8J7GNB6_9ACTN|nr:hypothetical protein [Longispora fulva]
MTAQPAAAAVNQANCTYTYNWSVNRVVATCFDDNSSMWYFRADCQRLGDGQILRANGTAAYGPGTSWSAVQCPTNTEVVDYVVVSY